MKFIETTEGFINTSAVTSVVRIKPLRKDGYRELTHLVQYGEHLTAYTWESECEALVTEIIPATPGYSVIHVCDDGSTFPEDIIAWQVHRTLNPVPITAEGAVEGNFGTLEPNGAVSVPYLGRFDTRADFERNAAEEWRKQQESAKAERQQSRLEKRPALTLKKAAGVSV